MRFLFLFFLFLYFSASAQKLVYEVELWGNKIGTSTIERIDEGNGEVKFTLNSTSEARMLFLKKTSVMQYDVVYKEGKLFSAYCKDVKDNVTHVTSTLWDGAKYVINKGGEILNLNSLLDYSSIQLYFTEPVEKAKIFSERLGTYCSFLKNGEGVYECRTDNGVNNIYRYKNGVLYEVEMIKGVSIYMRLVQ